MCGILGILGGEVPKEKFEKSLDLLKHRGPDAQGTYENKDVLLGHRRLSIVDLDPRSNQPFRYKNYCITFNGEIYNFKVLKNELEKLGHSFHTSSDTEILVHAYQEWNTKMFDKLDGMYAFCIYNTETKESILARDPIGEKPLVYCHMNNALYFSSELPSLLNLLSTKPEPNWAALANFNTYNFRHIPAPYTAYKNIFKLEPGYYIKFNSGTIEKKKYYFIPRTQTSCKKNHEVLKQALHQTQFSDAKSAIFLSGGVDSSIIASQSPKNTVTYSIGYDAQDPETLRAKKISKIFKLNNIQKYFSESKEQRKGLDYFKKLIKIYGEPIVLHQLIYADILLQEMKKNNIKVAIGGNGADELYYGYDGSNKLLAISKLKQLLDRLKLKIPSKHITARVLNEQPEKSKQLLYEQALRKKPHIKNKYKSFIYGKQLAEYATEIHSKKLIDIYNWLGLRIENEHSITIIADLVGSKNSMEIRSPFLNKIIINQAVNLNTNQKIRNIFSKKNNKYVLKKFLLKYLPRHLVYSKKRGFGYKFNTSQIFKENRTEIKRLLWTVAKNIPIYKFEEITKIYEEFYQKGSYEREFSEIVMVSIWYEEFIKNDINIRHTSRT